MAKACPPICRLFNHIPTPCPKPESGNLSLGKFVVLCSNARASKKDAFPQHLKKSTAKRSRTPRSLITLSTSDGRWHSQWTYDYVFSLRELQLADLAEEGQKDAEVSIHLSIQKHTGFGFSVDGRIMTSFTRKCSNCFSPYCREVIYVKPGSEVDLDSLIQETIRLTTSVKDTCSESCSRSPSSWHYIGGKEAYVDTRWSKLLEIKNKI